MENNLYGDEKKEVHEYEEWNHETYENLERDQEAYETHEIKDINGAYASRSEILYKEECFLVQGAIYEVYRVMGCGFLEAVYQECLQKEFSHRGIPFQAQVELPLLYKGERLAQKYRPDFICYDRIIVELKALKELGDEHRSQLINYLKATGLRVGLLVNFGHYPRATIERFIL